MESIWTKPAPVLTLKLTQEEAKWLQKWMQNPLPNEVSHDATMRGMFFYAIVNSPTES